MVTTALQLLFGTFALQQTYLKMVKCLVYCDAKKSIQIYQPTTEVNGEKAELQNDKRLIDCSP